MESWLSMDAISRRQMLQVGATAAFAAATVQAQQADQFDSTVINATSGIYIAPNTDGSFSVKMVSGDGTKNVTVIRYLGRTAEADARLVHDNLLSLLRILRLDV
jgi:hypothetical protein